ncbi:MAG: UDP-glucose 4-epimerase GalE [Candidatus Thiodiazotropha lotti]|uniref:UDP-glucose 4-epimerase n=1 Tax=Candidatus Thiodiazotropha endoloripes TaxID=1818881 RepID=A0A1E2UUV9_9GAMM|nr:UDP-glucose 4-epimerase GalE [Candidatus Thiodiazotropha endoloripes]MCG7899521.1 UDP-glucose 4-epimerase GalE [Candidatus Thiodiazotropha weberae]MCG7992920.1 UDP-glucose 4-epimerase GalE [Candidatus Thiodiazotropha lotti]MCG7903230.1 UDP-glucose 4-epimerase GalE [Candidatus Thiodiazotropha weberae]MCG7915605.1 UDP-glucose 4-epimerase GalE [Candidatus Thiodiazotropha weberae]MCG7998985.1 UDP-glucose 4-epimerase GalE [Candidatus Thiodiazotropha lotti]
MSKKGILVTGGAGYIGSHTARQLGKAGERLVTLDNLCTGFRQAVLYGDLVVGDTGDRELVSRILEEHEIDTVMHFAAHTIVPESVENPLKYYANNTCNTRSLLQCCAEAGVKNFVFSSTAAVYGIPEKGVAYEDTPTSPINPYGTSKLMSEMMLHDLSQATEMNYIALRYFNVAGCDLEGRIGQSTPKATLLTKVACEAAVGKRDAVYIFGTDYPTADGTGVRDYIHVEDLATAHVKALDYLRNGGDSAILNCGYGHGFSVRELLKSVEAANGSPLNIIEAERRAGDPPELVAGAEKVREVLGWSPKYDDLSVIASSALEWERKQLNDPWSN